MMADTDQGKQVRRYFLDCEKELKRRIAEDRQRHKQRVVKAIVSEEHTRWQKRFEDQFFEEAYRVTGRDKSPSGHPPWMGGFIKENIYGYFPGGSINELEKVNPKIDGRRKRKHHQHLQPLGLDGRRKRKHHQHLQPLGLNVLDSHKMAVIAIMRLSPDNNSNRFKQNLQKALGNTIQLELPFLDETE